MSVQRHLGNYVSPFCITCRNVCFTYYLYYITINIFFMIFHEPQPFRNQYTEFKGFSCLARELYIFSLEHVLL